MGQWARWDINTEIFAETKISLIRFFRIRLSSLVYPICIDNPEEITQIKKKINK